MPRALVLGGATGLLGQSIVAQLKKNSSWSVAVLGRNDGDVTNEAFLSKQIENASPDIIFNTIAWTQVDDAEDHLREAESMNADFPKMLATLLRPKDIHLIHISTDFVFGGSRTKPIHEEEQPTPESVYGSTKRAGEEYILSLLPERAAVLRTAWLFGPGKKNFVATILKAAQTHDQLRVVADQVGSPTYTVDLAAWCIGLAGAKATGIWHCVNAGSASWYDLAAKALLLTKSSCKVQAITSDQWPQKAKRPAYSVLCVDKLQNFLHAPVRSWEEALSDYIANLA